MSTPVVGSAAELRRAGWRSRALLVGAVVGGIICVVTISMLGAPGNGSSTSQAAATGQTAHVAALADGPDTHSQVLFGRYCDSCHPGAGPGIGADLRTAQVRRQYATPDSVIRLVRAGGFDMPAFPAQMLSDDDLAQIASYIVNLPLELS